MLLKSLVLFAVAVLASASSSTSEPAQNTTLQNQVCPDCVPCSVDCLCADTQKPTCAAPQPTFNPKFPNNPSSGPVVCAENVPCQDVADCYCPRALIAPTLRQIKDVCPEGQPCTSDCLCSLDVVLAFINPANLKGATSICPADKCTAQCICRDDLAKSMQAVLFPPAGSKVIDFGLGNETAEKKEKDEL